MDDKCRGGDRCSIRDIAGVVNLFVTRNTSFTGGRGGAKYHFLLNCCAASNTVCRLRPTKKKREREEISEGPVAQWIRHLTTDQGVPGSNPGRVTSFSLPSQFYTDVLVLNGG